MPGKRVQMVALVPGEPQRAGERRGRLLRWSRAAPLLETGVEVGRDVRQPSDFFPAQTARAPPRPGAQTDVAWPQRLAPAPEEIRQLVSVHAAIV